MAYQCEYCQKGVARGHAVSHAKNRTRRLFKPNLQKLKVIRDGVLQRAKLCTACIKRLKRDGRIGTFFLRKVSTIQKPEMKAPTKLSEIKEKKAVAKKEVKKAEKEKAQEKAKEALKIEEIVGRPGSK